MNTPTLCTVGHGNRPLEELIALLRDVGVATLVDVRAQPRSRHNPQFNDDSLRAACERAGLIYHWAGRQLGGMREPRADSPHVALDEGRRGFADHMDTDVFKKGVSQLQHLAAGSRGDSSFGDGGSGAHGNMAHGGHLRPLPKGLPPPEAIALSAVTASATQRTSLTVAARRIPFEKASPRKGVAHSPRALGATAQSACAILCAERDPAHCHRALIADFLTLQGMRVVHLLAPGETREHVLSPEARRESAALVYDRQVTGRLDL